MVLVGWAYALAFAPGRTPREVSGPAGQQPVTCPAAPCAGVGSLGLATDGDDVLVLLGTPAPGPVPPPRATATPTAAGPTSAGPTASRAGTGAPSTPPAAGTSRPATARPATAGPTPPASVPAPFPTAPAGTDRIELSFGGVPQQVLLERDGDGREWRVESSGRVWTAVAAGAGGYDVVRLPGPAPGSRWSAVVGDARVPARGEAPVARLDRPRDGVGRQPLQWAVGAGLAALLLGLYAYQRASARALRGAVRSIGYGLILVLGLPVLADRLRNSAPDLPGLLGFLASLAPLAALAVAAALARTLTAWVPPATVPSRGLRIATAAAVVALLALLGYAGELAITRWFPGAG